MVQIKFTSLRGFAEFPTPEVLVRNKLLGGREQWLDWFGSGIHIDDYDLNRFTNGFPKRYSLSARTDEMSNVMIACFGTDVIYTDSLETIKNKLLKMLEYMDYTRPYYGNYEIVR